MKYTLLLLLPLFFSACTSKYSSINSKPTYKCIDNTIVAPEWVCRDYVLDGYITALGKAHYKADTNQQLKNAQVDAKKNIGNKLISLELKTKDTPQQLKLWKNSKTKALFSLYIVKLN